MDIKRISRSFKDISLSFEPHPVTKDLPILKNENSIKRSVRNLVQTHFTERFFDSNIGSDISSTLFDFVDYASSSTIESQIISTLNLHEPRVENIVVQAEPRPDLNDFEVTITFDIIGQDFPTQNFTFLLEATR
jgi:phage baseplate assembly protein W